MGLHDFMPREMELLRNTTKTNKLTHRAEHLAMTQRRADVPGEVAPALALRRAEVPGEVAPALALMRPPR